MSGGVWVELAKAFATAILAGAASVLVQWAGGKAACMMRRRATEAGERTERRLAAILAADVVGYARLTTADEEGTHFRLLRHRREVIEPKIREHRGRVVKNTGDGALVEFGSAIAAVRCALEMQRVTAARNAGLQQSRRIELRIGVNIGDIIVTPDDIYGHAVNLAARLEGLAPPGGICISRDAWCQVRGVIAAEFVDMGEQQLKNIADPARVYAIAPAP
jgi:adenylate cyclase